MLLATCADLPDLEPEDRPLVPALRALGLEVGIGVWTNPSMDWGAARAVVIRSVWDYHLRHDAFLRWAGGVPRLWNPLELVRWNASKAYLRDLAAWGFPTIPTVWVDAGGTVAELPAGWDMCVVKPLVSASAYQTLKTRDRAAIATHAAGLAGALVQPYVAGVEREGERALVFLDGVFSHAIRKAPALGGGDVHAYAVVPAAGDEVELASQVLARVGETLYARVDVVRDDRGGLLVMELELVEPSLYFTRVPGAAERLAEAIARRQRGSRSS